MKGMPTPIAVVGAVLLAACVPGWWTARSTFLAAWLAAWLFFLGVILGGLANLWIHSLTGGAWGEAIRPPLLRLARAMPWLSLLFLPILAGQDFLYPWSARHGEWANELAEPSFKFAWLQPWAFTLRAIVVLLLWNALAWASRQPRLQRSRGFAAAALLLYAFSGGVAAVDWVMSLMPAWYSSSFGLLLGIGQVLGGMAFAALAVCGRPDCASTQARRDIGNFLFAYVLTWAYLAFTQFLIIWAENLPHEISWYVARRDAWLPLGVAVALFNFAVPIVLLLFRAIKDSARRLGWVATGLLAARMLDLWWLVLPSVADRIQTWQLAWLLPLSAVGFASLGYGLMQEEIHA